MASSCLRHHHQQLTRTRHRLHRGGALINPPTSSSFLSCHETKQLQASPHELHESLCEVSGTKAINAHRSNALRQLVRWRRSLADIQGNIDVSRPRQDQTFSSANRSFPSDVGIHAPPCDTVRWKFPLSWDVAQLISLTCFATPVSVSDETCHATGECCLPFV